MTNNFCSSNNIPDCFSTLSKELEVLGFTPVTFEEDDLESCIVNLLNSMWSMLSDSKQKISKINELNEKIFYIGRQSVSQEQSQKKHLTLLKEERGKCIKLEEQLTDNINEKEKLMLELKELKKEVESLTKGMKSIELQYVHDLKRKETLIHDLKSKLVAFSNVEAKCKTERTDKEENKCESIDSSTFQKYFRALQNNIQTLLSENANLRASIIGIYNLITINKQLPLIKERNEILLNLPYQRIINEIEGDIQKILNVS